MKIVNRLMSHGNLIVSSQYVLHMIIITTFFIIIIIIMIMHCHRSRLALWNRFSYPIEEITTGEKKICRIKTKDLRIIKEMALDLHSQP